jgi:peptidyl-prolyl cis-trans isomerase B (cyclophilin B)
MKMTTNYGVIVLELDAEKAPETTRNFQHYVANGHYNGTVFHRVIPGFMIQGGGFEPGMQQKSTEAPIQNEADNGLKNDVGTIAMARTGDPHSATAQFFINTSDNDFLNFRSKDARGWGYTVFGKVVEGLDVVRKIEAVSTHTVGPYGDVPVQDVIIEKIEPQ